MGTEIGREPSESERLKKVEPEVKKPKVGKVVGKKIKKSK